MNKRHIKIGSLRSPRQRRQRTTSINLTKTIDATESIIRANNRTIYTAGRPPWYDCAGQQVEPFVIGLFSFVWFICTKQKKKTQKSPSSSFCHPSYCRSHFTILSFLPINPTTQYKSQSIYKTNQKQKLIPQLMLVFSILYII